MSPADEETNVQSKTDMDDDVQNSVQEGVDAEEEPPALPDFQGGRLHSPRAIAALVTAVVFVLHNM